MGGSRELDSSGSGYGPIVGHCEHGNAPSGYVKGREILDCVNDCWLLKKDSAPRS
jgi:hypothetical protein